MPIKAADDQVGLTCSLLLVSTLKIAFQLLGVAQVINKKGQAGVFTAEDEEVTVYISRMICANWFTFKCFDSMMQCAFVIHWHFNYCFFNEGISNLFALLWHCTSQHTTI